MKSSAHRLKVSQYIPGFDPCVEVLGRSEVADVGVRYDCDDEISDSPLRLGEEFIILASRLVDGLFLGSDGILCAFSDGGIVDSRLLWRSKRCAVFESVRPFVLDEADKVVDTLFINLRDLVKSLR